MTQLTLEERRKFSQWCDEQATANELIAVQLAAMNVDSVASRYRMSATAYRHVSIDLLAIETVEIRKV